jgi:hypothetical protein
MHILVNVYHDGLAEVAVFVGPFPDEATAEKYMEQWPDDEGLVEKYICPLNDPATVGVISYEKRSA